MAEPIDSAVIFEDIPHIVQQQYDDRYSEQYVWFKKMTNKLFRPDSKIVPGMSDGINVQCEIGPSDSGRMSNNVLGAFAAPGKFYANEVKLRFNKQDATANDFARYTASCQTDEYDVNSAGRGSIVNFVTRLVDMIDDEFEEKLAIHRHLPRTGLIGLVNGTPKKDDVDYFSGASATATNAAGMRVPIDSGSISYFKTGRRFDIIRSGVVIAGNVQVTSTHPDDLSVGFKFVTATTGVLPAEVSTGNLGSVADNDEFYLSGSYGNGMWSLGGWMTQPAATGDSFIGGENRMDTDNRYLIPTMSRVGATAAPLTKAMFNTQANNMNYVSEDEVPVVFLQNPDVTQRIRDEVGEQAIIQLPVGSDKEKQYARFGLSGLVYQHPMYGVVMLVSDALATPNTVRIIEPETWRTVYVNQKGLKMLPGDGGKGWYRISDSAPNVGRGMIYKMDFYATLLDFCYKPFRNGAILNITT